MNYTKIIKIKAVGDICPGDKAIMGMGVLGMSKKYGADFPFQKIKKCLTDTDIMIGNLEGLLTRKIKKRPYKEMAFCGLPEFANVLYDVGFNVINVANNHILEYGHSIFFETISCLKKAGIKVCGLRSKSSKYYSDPVIIFKKNKKIGILGYNWVGKDKFRDADNYIAQSHDSVVNYTWDRDRQKDLKKQRIAYDLNQNVIKDIKTLKKEVDVVILLTHWGIEFVNSPPYGVTLEAKSFIDAGVDLILGGHPHVLQGMEIYRQKMIFYSLGNFIFDFRDSKTKNTAIMDIWINNDQLILNNFLPCYINKHFQPEPAASVNREKIIKIFDQSCDEISNSNVKTLLNDDDIYKQYEEYYRFLKIKTIFDHILELKKNPKVLSIIFRKFISLFEIIKLRLKGEKVRW